MEHIISFIVFICVFIVLPMIFMNIGKNSDEVNQKKKDETK